MKKIIADLLSIVALSALVIASAGTAQARTDASGCSATLEGSVAAPATNCYFGS